MDNVYLYIANYFLWMALQLSMKYIDSFFKISLIELIRLIHLDSVQKSKKNLNVYM